MIPKIIHYCWFGGNPLPKLAVRCIESWKKYLPDYEIKEWNEQNFDVKMVAYTREAYQEKKYAYVSDYARLWILYQYGGIYFDTDVEVIRPMNDILERGPFMGCEKNASDLGRYPDVNPGVGLCCYPHDLFIGDLLMIYHKMSFESENKSRNKGIYKTIVSYTTDLLVTKGLQNVDGIQQIAGYTIYPKDYFNPLEHVNQLKITENTRTIHHYAATWAPLWVKIFRKVVRLLGPKMYSFILRIQGK
ncbi:glycosyltransferase family 32 protein [Prevotella sp. SGI.027]|nr:glycosyltransferase [Prevotella sp.]